MKNEMLDCHRSPPNVVCKMVLDPIFVPSRFMSDSVYGNVNTSIQSKYNTCILDHYSMIHCSGAVYSYGWIYPRRFIPFNYEHLNVGGLSSNFGFNYDPLTKLNVDGYQISVGGSFVKDITQMIPHGKNISFDAIGVLYVDNTAVFDVIPLNQWQSLLLYYGLTVVMFSFAVVLLKTNNVLNPVSTMLSVGASYFLIHVIVWDILACYSKLIGMYLGIVSGYLTVLAIYLVYHRQHTRVRIISDDDLVDTDLTAEEELFQQKT